ncbi:MAG: hypothetical protein UW80_C0052G0005 [Microgenomates group bacterium GW2011_GWC1_44_9]|nr:MAG: hypothetical protein UW80_C0052G0005 [Microgenomates group bacterium GW2011_GWC1_44_9]
MKKKLIYILLPIVFILAILGSAVAYGYVT